MQTNKIYASTLTHSHTETWLFLQLRSLFFHNQLKRLHFRIKTGFFRQFAAHTMCRPHVIRSMHVLMENGNNIKLFHITKHAKSDDIIESDFRSFDTWIGKKFIDRYQFSSRKRMWLGICHYEKKIIRVVLLIVNYILIDTIDYDRQKKYSTNLGHCTVKLFVL